MHPLGSDTTQHAIKLVASETQVQPKLVQAQVMVQNVCNPWARSNATFQTHFNIQLALARSTDVRNMMAKRGSNGLLSLPLIQHDSTSSYSLILATVSRQCFHGSWESQAGVICYAFTTPTPHHATNVHSHILAEGEGVSTVAGTRLRLYVASSLWGSVLGGLVTRTSCQPGAPAPVLPCHTS